MFESPAWCQYQRMTPVASLYDGRRDVYYAKPVLRGWSHLLWFVASLVAGIALFATANGARELTAVAVYGLSVSALFGVSALYHRGNWSAASSRVLQRFDHALIFVLIAGTATPPFLIGIGGRTGLLATIALWAVTGTLIVIHLCWMGAPEVLVGGCFIALGCGAGLALPAVWIHRGVVPALLMLLGGILYAVGAIGYHRRRPDPVPSVFGYHEVFHAYVCVAATCQFLAIAVYIV